VRRFDHFAVIDWSGQAAARPKGLALAHARAGNEAPSLLKPQDGWSRPALLDWLRNHGEANTDLLIGLDLSPALPFVDHGAYFPGWRDSPPDAKSLWAMVDDEAREDEHLGTNGFLRHAEIRRHFRQHLDCGDLFEPGRGRLRVCEIGQKAMGMAPSSCFNLVGAAQVGKSSLTGMRVLHRLAGAVPIWPFDPMPEHGPVSVEIYTSIAARAAGIRAGLSKIRDGETLDAALAALGSGQHRPIPDYDDHSTDAILTTAWLRAKAGLPELWAPDAMTPQIARTEGWTFGVA